MRTLLPLCVTLVMGLSACRHNPVATAERDPAKREQLFAAVKALAGDWTAPMPDGSTAHAHIEPSAGGSVIVETMFPGLPHQMTDAYHLDGNSLVLTHYCGGGNQPRMRATQLQGNTLHFSFDSVTDLAAPDALYMGEMTLELVSATRMVQRWKALKSGEVDHEMVFNYTRAEVAASPDSASAHSDAAHSDAVTAQPMSEAEMMARTMELASPAAVHAKLMANAGDWEQEYRMRWDPNTQWQETKGTSTARTLLDGRYLMEEIQFELMGMPMKGVHLMGYDKRTGEYITLWMDTMSTWWISQRGKEGPDGAIELRGTMIDVAGERPFRSVIRHLPDGSVTTEMFDTIPPHGEIQVMSIRARKRG
jgi:hypothetical protein